MRAPRRRRRACSRAPTRRRKNGALERLAELLGERADEILEANAADLADERAAGLSDALRDRLTVTPERVAAMAEGVRAIVALPDPVGEELERKTLEGGLDLRKVRVPLGVVAVVYEARPNVTIDCAALTIKSGNAIVLRGSSYAERSNAALAGLVREALVDADLPAAAVELLGGDRSELEQLATAEGLVDLIIPRGGDGLKQALKAVATVPVMYAASGNCHVYVHADADLEMARRIAVNAKVHRPGCLQRGRDAACPRRRCRRVLARARLQSWSARASSWSATAGRARRRRARRSARPTTPTGTPSTCDLKMTVGVVDSLDEAIEHVNRHGSGHSEAIVTGSEEAGERFTGEVDAAVVYVNASTRFTDGFVFGMGAEIGNSTQKLHARGPIGMRELTTTKYVVHGDGQVRG